jgi:large subunit ribosomal protein L14
MIQLNTYLDVADNTGVKKIMCIKVMRANAKIGRIGDIIVASVKEVIPTSSFKLGDVVKAVIVRTKKEYKREDDSYIKFDTNSAVILDEFGNPKGTRIFGPIPRDLRKRFAKLLTLAPEVV